MDCRVLKRCERGKTVVHPVYPPSFTSSAKHSTSIRSRINILYDHQLAQLPVIEALKVVRSKYT